MIPSLNNQSYKSICDSKKINPDAVCLPSFFSSSDSDLELKEWSQSFKKDLPDWVPESVKNLFKETIFAENYNDVFSALKQDNKHILWPVGNHLLAWEKKDGKFSLTIICSQKKSMPPVAGKAFSIFSVLANLINKDSFSTQLSEWTDESKTRIDPIAVVYENLEESVFSEEWLSAIEENKVTPELFLPLQESQRKPQVLKFPDDKKGYLKRFKTNQRGDDTLWLYKTWMRHHLPIEDYKKFNFLNKYSLIENTSEEAKTQVAEKLLRSLGKNRFTIEDTEREQIYNTLKSYASSKKQENIIQSYPIVVTPVVEKNHVEQVLPPVALQAATNIKLSLPPTLHTPYQWGTYVDEKSLPDLDDPIWDISSEPCKVGVMLLALRSSKLRGEKNDLLSFLRTSLVIKNLFKQISEELAEKIDFLGKDIKNIDSFHDLESHSEVKKYLEELKPKKDVSAFLDSGSLMFCSDKDKSFYDLFISLLAVKDINEEQNDHKSELIKEIIQGRGFSENSKKLFPIFINNYYSLIEGLKYAFPHRSNLRFHHIETDLFLAESREAKAESFDPWNHARNVARDALPYIGPEQALINFSRTNHEKKYLQDHLFTELLDDFFQEAWQKPNLKSIQDFYDAKIDGKLPWVERLKDDDFKLTLEKFLEDELKVWEKYGKLNSFALKTFIHFSAICSRYRKDLKIPDYEAAVSKLQNKLSTLDRSFKNRDKEKNNVELSRAYLFLLFAEKEEEKANIYRPQHLETVNNLINSKDKKRILHFLKKLPELENTEQVYPLQFRLNFDSLIDDMRESIKELLGVYPTTPFNISNTNVEFLAFSYFHFNIGTQRFSARLSSGLPVINMISSGGMCTLVEKKFKINQDLLNKYPVLNSDALVFEQSSSSFLFYEKTSLKFLGTLTANKYSRLQSWSPASSTNQNATIAQATESKNSNSLNMRSSWWTGEKINVIEQENVLRLEDHPDLIWRNSDSLGLHGNELVDINTGEVKKHVFNLEIMDQTLSFPINIENGEYQPINLEEYLCLLLVYLKSNNLDGAWKILKKMPLITCSISNVSAAMIKLIIAGVSQTELSSFDQLTLAMQITERFFTWFKNPSLDVSEELKSFLAQSSLAAFEMYRDLQQNVDQKNLLTISQREDLKSEYPKQIKNKIIEVISNYNPPKFSKPYHAIISSRFFQKTLKYLLNSSSYSNKAWYKSVEPSIRNLLSEAMFGLKFYLDDFTVISSNLKYEQSDNLATKIIKSARKVTNVFLRIFGFRFIYQERVDSLKDSCSGLEKFIPDTVFSPDIRTKKRLEIAVEKTKSSGKQNILYVLDIIDYAIVSNLVIKEGESVEHFVARVEQVKYTKNIFHKLIKIVEFHFWLIKKLISVYKSLPTTPKINTSEVRDPFELFRKKDYNVENDGQLQVEIENILDFANKSNDRRETLLSSKLEQKVEWSHLEGLFVQNDMRRLITINPALTASECDAIDAKMRAFYIDRAAADYSYNPHEESSVVRCMLVFEKITSMKIRPQQYEKLKILLSPDENGKYRNLALQMEMGGGKTSVLTSLALIQAAKSGRIAIFVPPAAQYESLTLDLTRWQKARFQQEVIPIKLSFSKMQDLESLEWLLERIKEAKTLSHVLLMHPTTLHNLRLSWMSNEDPECLNVLFKIRNELKTNSDVLIDEIDQALDPLKDTSMAHGNHQNPSKKLLKRFKKLIDLHSNNDKIWEALCENQPQKIDIDEYKKFQKETIAPMLRSEYNVPEKFSAGFDNYLVGKATTADSEFLTWLSSHEFKDDIAQYKHWMEDILVFSITREKGRHYGRAEDGCAVVPYNGVSSPAKTKFAQLGEEISYYFLTAISSKYTQKQFDEVFTEFKNRYDRFDKLKSEVVKDVINKEFKDITGIDLIDALKSEEKRKAALDNLNSDPIKRTSWEVYLAEAHIEYFDAQLTSTSQDFLGLFNTHRGFSGTFPGFINEFDHIIEADKDSDASVEKAIKDHKENTVEVENLENFFSNLDAQNSPLGGLIDNGALFRNFTNEEVAHQVLDQLPHIQTVLFFSKKNSSDEAPDTPMILKRTENGRFIKQAVGSTKKEILQIFGVNPESLFVYYDQRHCEATDVYQLPDRRNACTFGLKTTHRDLLQGIMRLRNYKAEQTHQTVTFVLDATTKKKLFGDNPATPESILAKAKEIEKEETALRSYRTYYHRIDAAFVNAVEDLMEKKTESQASLEKLRSFFIRIMIDKSAFKQFGGIGVEIDTKVQLNNYMEARLKAFKSLCSKSVPDTLRQDLEKIRAAIQSCSRLNEKTSIKASANLGQQQEQEIRQEVEQLQETEKVLKEPGKGRPWQEKREYRSIELKNHYGKSLALVSKEFDSKLFDGLKASENFLHTYSSAYGLNHPDQKRANYLLLERVEGEGIVPTILSGYDYHNYNQGRKLPPNSCVCCAFTSEDGSILNLLGHLDLTSEEKVKLKKIMMQIAFLNGNASYIIKNSEDTKFKIEENHIKFLKRRVEYWQTRREFSGSSYYSFDENGFVLLDRHNRKMCFTKDTVSDFDFERKEVLNILPAINLDK